MSNEVANAYQRNGIRPVAYIDESYRGPQEGGQHFYLLTAVIVQASERDSLRSGIEEIVGDGYWHTSEAISQRSGVETAEELLNYLNDGDEISVVSLQTPNIQNDLETMRRDCMFALLPSLEKGSADRSALKLALLERRRDRKEQNSDTRIHSDLVKSSELSQHFRLMQVSPAQEHLLWLPDLVSYAARGKITGIRKHLFEIIEDKVEWI